MNKVMLIGNLTRDPELTHIQSGTALAKLGLAVSRRYKNKQTGEWSEDTAFVDTDAWGNTAEFCGKYLCKGTRVYVEGSLHFSSWEAQDGSKRSKLSVTAERVQFALPKAQQEAPAPSQGYTTQYENPQHPPLSQQSPQGGYGGPPPGAVPPAAPPDNTADDLPF